jgi:hypothetical protein
MNDVLKKLEGGDRRSIGRVSDVVAEVFNDPSLFEVVFNGILYTVCHGILTSVLPTALAAPTNLACPYWRRYEAERATASRCRFC